MAMHYGQGAAAAIIRALMSADEVRGPFADFMFMCIRLLIDQTLGIVTGVGALPWRLSSFDIHITSSRISADYFKDMASK